MCRSRVHSAGRFRFLFLHILTSSHHLLARVLRVRGRRLPDFDAHHRQALLAGVVENQSCDSLDGRITVDEIHRLAEFLERLDEWIGELSKTDPVVTYCVYGFHIGCETAVTLRKAGFDARYMAGGHYAWKALKGPVKLFT